MEREMDRRIGAASAVMRALYRSVGMMVDFFTPVSFHIDIGITVHFT